MPRWLTVTTAGIALSILAASAFAQVRVLTEDEIRQRRAAELGRLLVKALPGILTNFQVRRRKLPLLSGGNAYEAAAVESLLRETETALRGALGDEELAPLRDYVAETFRAVRERLGRPRQAGLPRSPRILFARWSADTESVDRGAVDIALDQIGTLIQKIFSRAKSQELIVTLCVVSQPDGAKFTMSAPSLPDKPYETRTNGEFDAFRGLYGYAIEKGSKFIRCMAPPAGERWSCIPVNLVDDPPVLDCDLGTDACQHRNRVRGDCRRRGR